MSPPTITVSVDMDAPENYAEFYRRPKEEALPLGEFYDRSLPTLLGLFDEHGILGTFFCIGEHAERPEGREAVGQIAARGHEIANHTYSHPIAFRGRSREAKNREIRRAHEVLASLAGDEAPVGFRAPAYDLDRETLEILADLGYAYDSSQLPSPWLEGAKWVVRWRSRRWRVGLGTWRLQWGSAEPRLMEVGDGRLTELPLSVLPPWRFPFYGSMTQARGLAWFRRGLDRLRRRSRPIHYSLHLQELAETPKGVPGYEKSPAERKEILSKSLALLADGSRCLRLTDLADKIASP